MTDTVVLMLTAHTPFRVGTGSAAAGADAAVDRQVPLPGASIKGVMRDAAAEILAGTGHPLLAEVFGEPTRPGERGRAGGGSPWHWDDAELDSPPDVVARARTRLDSDTGTVEPGALLVGEEVAPVTGTVQIWRSGHVPPGRLPTHRALLLAAAAAVDGLGAGRRAGSGWVTLTPADPADAARWLELVDLLLAERRPLPAEATPSSEPTQPGGAR